MTKRTASTRLPTAAVLAVVAVGLPPSPAGADGSEAAPASSPNPSYGAVVTARRREQPVQEAQRAVSVVDRATARRAIAAGPGDALESADGLSVQRTSSARPTVLVRGLTGNRVLVLYDEIRLNDSLTKVGGNALLGLLDPEAVGAVEVVRGPASVLHGSDALGGVVHALPHEPPGAPVGGTAWEAETFLRGASAERAVHGRASVEGATGTYAGRVSAGGAAVGDVVRGGGLGAQPYTGHAQWATSARGVARLDGAQRIGVAFMGAEILDEPRSDASRPGDVRTTPEHRRDLGYAWYEGRPAGGRTRVGLRAGAMRRREVRTRERTGRPTDRETDEVRTAFAAARGVLRPWRPGRPALTLGADGSTDWVERRGRGPEPRDTYLVGGAYALLEQGLGAAWALDLGGRVAAFGGSAFGDRGARTGAVGSVGVRRTVAPGVALVASAMSGFRAPNLEDLRGEGAGARGYTLSNPDLGDERSLTGEVGIKLAPPGTGLGGQAYAWASRLTGLIVRTPARMPDGRTEVDGDPVVRRENATDGRLMGAEVEVSRRWKHGIRLGFGASAAWGEATTLGATGPIDKVPPPAARATLSYDAPSGRWWAEAEVLGAAEQLRLSDGDRDDGRICPDGPDGCDRTGRYALATLRGGVHLDEDLTLLAAVENVADAPWRPFASGVEGHGINVVAAIRGRLGRAG